MEVAALTIRVLLATVFGLAGLAKIADPVGSQQALRDFGVPTMLVPGVAPLLSFLELAIAIAFIPAATAWWAACGASTLLVLFALGIILALGRGNRPNCHCFGNLASAPIGWPTLARNLVLAAAAAFIVWQGPETVGLQVVGDLMGAKSLWLFMGMGVLALLAAEGWLLLHLLRQNGRLLLRIEALEGRFATGGAPMDPAWKPAAQALPGLPVGALAPSFRLGSLIGEMHTLNGLRAAAKPIILIFSDLSCTACEALLPEISRWQSDYVSQLTIALISGGRSDAKSAKIMEYGLTNVLLQQDGEVAKAYKVVGTPSAVLVYPDGTIGSPLSEGADGIRVLVARTVGLSTPAADLQLPDLAGNLINFADFGGSPVLIVFWNPNCGFCKQMLLGLKVWEGHLPQNAKVLIVSTGSVKDNLAMGLRSTIVLDAGFMAGRALGVNGTPSAVLIDAEGNVASEVAAGADAVMALANRVSKLAAEPALSEPA